MKILIVGYPYSGKTTARNANQNVFQCDGYKASGYVNKIMSAYKVKDIQEIQNMMACHVVTREIISYIQDRNKLIVVSGLRTCKVPLLLKIFLIVS